MVLGRIHIARVPQPLIARGTLNPVQVISLDHDIESNDTVKVPGEDGLVDVHRDRYAAIALE
jgi:hypothetical protein